VVDEANAGQRYGARWPEDRGVVSAADDDGLIYSDQGAQYGSDDWSRFCRGHNLKPSTIPRGGCWGSAVVESFFIGLNKECRRHRVYRTRDVVRSDLVNCVEVFYKRPRRSGRQGQASPAGHVAASSQGRRATTKRGKSTS